MKNESTIILSQQNYVIFKHTFNFINFFKINNWYVNKSMYLYNFKIKNYFNFLKLNKKFKSLSIIRVVNNSFFNIKKPKLFKFKLKKKFYKKPYIVFKHNFKYISLYDNYTKDNLNKNYKNLPKLNSFNLKQKSTTFNLIIEKNNYTLNTNSVTLFNFLLFKNPYLFLFFNVLKFSNKNLYLTFIDLKSKFRNSYNTTSNLFLVYFLETILNKKIYMRFVIRDLNKFKRIHKTIVNIWGLKLGRYDKILDYRFNVSKFVKVIFKAFLYKDLNLLWSLIDVGLKRLKFSKHKVFFRFLFFVISSFVKDVFTLLNITGLNMEIKGKIFRTGKVRKKKIVLRLNYNSKSKYYYKTKYLNKPNSTISGSLCMRFWLYFK